MGRFLRKCALAAAIAALFLYLGGAAYRQTDTYRNREVTEETAHYAQLPDLIGTAVFGSSHGRDAFQAWEGTEGFFNFSMSSQTPEYDWMQFREFSSRFREDALVIITVSYMSPYWTESQEAFEQKQERYYRILSPKNIVDVDLAHYWLQRLSPLLTEDIQDVAPAFFQRLVPAADQAEKSTDRETALSEQSRIVRDHLSLIEPVYPEVSPVMWEAYRNILSRCQEEGWTGVLVTPPYLEEYNQVFSQEFYQQFSRQVQSLCQEYGVVWLDYSHREEYAQSYGWFRNIDHLNAAGSAEFLRVLQADLETVRPAA